MAFTVTFAHEEAKEFDGANDTYNIDSGGVLHLTYAETTGGLGKAQTVRRALSPHAWLEVTETTAGSPIAAVQGTHPGHSF